MPGNAQIQVRRDTASNWTSANPTLADGEPGFETDTGKCKIGDGATAWGSLAYQGVVDGDKGDVTVSGGTWTIDNGVVTLAKMANMATASVIYRKTAGSGAPEVQTLATLKTDLGLTGTNSGDQTITLTGDATGSGTSSFAVTVGKINGTALSGLATGILKNTTGTGVPSIAVAGDFPTLNQNTTGSAATLTTSRNFAISGGGITAAAVGFTGAANVTLSASVDVGHITLARMADVATGTVFYRKTAGSGAPEVQTLATLKTDLGLTGTNSGDQTSIVGITGTKSQFDTACTDGNFLYVGDVTQYTDEMAQDAIGAMVDTTLTYVDATPLLQRAALTGAITASAGSNATALGSFTLAELNTAVSDADVASLGVSYALARGAITL